MRCQSTIRSRSRNPKVATIHSDAAMTSGYTSTGMTVLDYLKPRLEGHPHSAAVLNLADELIGEVAQ